MSDKFYTETEIRAMGAEALSEYKQLLESTSQVFEVGSKSMIQDVISLCQQYRDMGKKPYVFITRKDYNRFRLAIQFSRDGLFKETPFQILKENGLVGEISDRATKIKCYSDFFFIAPEHQATYSYNVVIGLDKVAKTNEKHTSETAAA